MELSQDDKIRNRKLYEKEVSKVTVVSTEKMNCLVYPEREYIMIVHDDGKIKIHCNYYRADRCRGKGYYRDCPI